MDDLAVRVAVLERDVAALQRDQGGMLETQKQMAADLHAIRQLIDKGKGGIFVLGLLAAIAGGAGALLHKLLPPMPWTPP
jgi:hypothetical protein